MLDQDWGTGGLVDWWTGGLVDWWTGGLVDWWTGGLMHCWIGRPMDWCTDGSQPRSRTPDGPGGAGGLLIIR